MIFGIGTDIVKTERFKATKESFLRYTFTEKELEEAKGSINTLAGKYAAKEAASKAFGTGFRGFGLKDVEILKDELGKPYVILHGNVGEKYSHMKINVSISHEKEYAIAFAVIEEVEK